MKKIATHDRGFTKTKGLEVIDPIPKTSHSRRFLKHLGLSKYVIVANPPHSKTCEVVFTSWLFYLVHLIL